MKPRIISSILAVLLFGSVLFQVQIHNLSLYLLVLWFVSSFLDYKKEMPIILSNRKYTCLLIFFVFYYISATFAHNAYFALVRTLEYIPMFVPILMYDQLKYCGTKTKNVVLLSSVVLLLLYAIRMYSFLSLFGAELGMRSFIGNIDGDYFINNSFYFVYSIPIIVSCVILCIKQIYNNRTVRKHWFVYIIFLISFIVILSNLLLKSLYMTATILLILSVIAGLVYNTANHRWILKAGVVVVLCLILYVSYYSLVRSYVSQIGSTIFDQRIEELYDVISGNAKNTIDFNERQGLTGTSLETFLKYPVFGANHVVIGTVNEEVVGNHAEWLDLLAEYGLFSLLIFYTLFITIKELRLRKIFTVPIVLYLLTGFLNPMMHLIVNYSLFVFVPLFFDYFDVVEDRENNLIV